MNDIALPLPEPRRWTSSADVGRCWVSITRRPDVPREWGASRGFGFAQVNLGHTALTLGWR